MLMMHIKLHGIMKCSNMVANILPADPPLDPRVKRSKFTFSEQYQIKVNHKCS